MLLDSYDNQLRHTFFYTKKDQWESLLASLLEPVRNEFQAAAETEQIKTLEFLTDLAIGLKSKLTHWHLLNEIGAKALTDAHQAACALLEKYSDTQAARLLLDAIAEKTIQRFVAEGMDQQDAPSMAAALLDGSLTAYVKNVIALIDRSCLADQAEANIDGVSPSYIGNDYGAFLKYFTWFGASFQTTNPPLVKMAWDLDEAKNGAIFRDLVAYRFGEHIPDCGSKQDLDELYSLFVITIIERSCRLLRDIFLCTGGKTGFVCYQVNPGYHDNGAAMAEEAVRVHAIMEKRLGGVPNISFKLPGTRAGLEAAAILAPKGFSLTITLCFGLFQACEFARVLNKGEAVVSSVVIMNGRLAFPVRDELTETEVEGATTASRRAGVEITRHLYRKLYNPESKGGMGCDPATVRILNASLRLYGTEIPDVTDIWGTPSITIFPNIRRAYDLAPRTFSLDAIENPTADQDVQILMQSQIFKQAWWIEGDPEEYRPSAPLSLTEECDRAVVEWIPVAATLAQFMDAWEQSLRIIKAFISTANEALYRST